MSEMDQKLFQFVIQEVTHFNCKLVLSRTSEESRCFFHILLRTNATEVTSYSGNEKDY